ncbi:MAG: hypothetical protein AAB436_04940 [Patescibacteria group bacterium]
MKKALALVLFLLLAGLLSSEHAVAAKPSSQITIVPFLQSVRVQASEPTKTFDLTLTNKTAQTQNFHLSVLNFGTLNETGGLVFTGSNTKTLAKKYGIASWLRLSTNDLSLQPNQTATVQATIINDSSLSPGGHYGAVVASVNSSDVAGSNQVNVKQELSSLVFATKVGGEKYDLKLDSMRYESSWGRLPSSVTLRFKNTGNVQVVPRGIVKLISPRGRVISQGAINEASSYVLPETYRQIPVSLQNVAREGWWPKFYRLEIYYRYDGINSFATKSYTLYLVNLPAIIVSTLTLAALLVAAVQLWRYEARRRSRPKPVASKVVYKKPPRLADAKKAAKKTKKSSQKKAKKAAE